MPTGILDLFGDPDNQGLLGAAAGLLQSSGPSRMPVSFGQAIGQGLNQGMQGYTQAVRNKQLQQLADSETAKTDLLKQQLAQAQAQFALQQRLLGQFGFGATPGAAPQPTPAAGGPAPVVITNPEANQPFGPMPTAPQQGTTFPFNPTQLAALRLAGLPDLTGAYNAAQPNVDIRNGMMFDKKSGKIIGTVPQTNQQGFSTITVPDPSSPSGFRIAVVPGAEEAFGRQQDIGERAKATYDLVTVPPTSPNAPPTYNSRLNLVSPSVQPQGETPVQPQKAAPNAAGMSPAQAATQAADAAQQLDISKNYAKIYGDLQNNAMANPGKIAKYERIGQLLGDFEGGKLTKTGFEMARLANSAGLKIDPNLPNKEAAESLANAAALDMRSTAGGAGMPGQLSDADREYLKQMTPNMAQTAQGRKTIIDTQVKLLQRQNQVANMARQYKKKYGKVDEDFFTQLQAWSNRNPIFTK